MMITGTVFLACLGVFLTLAQRAPTIDDETAILDLQTSRETVNDSDFKSKDTSMAQA